MTLRLIVHEKGGAKCAAFCSPPGDSLIPRLPEPERWPDRARLRERATTAAAGAILEAPDEVQALKMLQHGCHHLRRCPEARGEHVCFQRAALADLIQQLFQHSNYSPKASARW